MRISITVNGRCSGQCHAFLTVTARRENSALIGSRDVVLTMDEILGVEPAAFLDNLPLLLRSFLLEQGYTKATPLATLKSAIEAKEFRI